MTRALPALAAAGFVGAWGLLSLRLPPALLPSPLEVGLAAVQEAPRLAQATAATAISAVGGLALGGAAAAVGAVLFVRSRVLEAALAPYALLVQTVPIVAIAPLLVVWLGYGRPVAVATAAIVSFFPILTSTTAGLRATPPEQVDLLRLYGANWTQELLRLRVPGALPWVFTGLRTATGLSVIGAIVGEFVGSNGLPVTLGYLVLMSTRSARTDLCFAAVAASTALALGMYAAVRLAESRAIGPWHPGGAA